MTQPVSPLPTLMFVVAFCVLAVFLGLWQVGWHFQALPGWFYAYALGAAVVARLGLHLRALDGPQRSYRQRLLLRGFGWGLPLAALVSGRPALEGDFQEPALTLLFLGLWSLLSLLSGALSLRKEKKAAQGSKAAQAAKDWP